MTNDFLLYVTKKTVDTFKAEVTETEMSEFHLYKMLYIIHERLFEKGIDIELPYMWYRLGTIPYSPAFQEVAGVSLNYFSNQWTLEKTGKHLITSPNVKIPTPSNNEEINNEIDALISEIKRKDKKQIIQHLSERTYNYAPYSFQRTFKIFEESLTIENYSDSKTVFKKLIKEFPEDEFEEIFDLYLEWETVVATSFEIEEYNVIQEINLPFWNAFCYPLSIKHNNLPNKYIASLLSLSKKGIPREEEKIFTTSSEFYKSISDVEITPQSIEDINKLNKLMRDDYF